MVIDVDPEQDFHVVIDGVSKAFSLDDLAEAYQADLIRDETLIWQQGLVEWMRLDTLLAALGEEEEAPPATAPASHENVYSVRVAPDEIKSMTLQTLAEAHRLGVVDDETLVWQPGYTEWVPLVVIIAGFATHARLSIAPSPAPTQQLPMPQVVHQPSAYQPQLAATPVAVAAPAPHGMPDVIPFAPNTLVPTATDVNPMSQGLSLSTSAPYALDDLDFPAFQNSKSVWLKRSSIGVGALALVFVIYQGTSGSAGELAVQPGAAATQSVSPVASPVVQTEPSAWEKEQALLEAARRKDEAAAKEAANRPAANAFGAHLAGENQLKNDAPVRARSAGQSKAKRSSASSKKTKSGNSQYDPMNGAL